MLLASVIVRTQGELLYQKLLNAAEMHVFRMHAKLVFSVSGLKNSSEVIEKNIDKEHEAEVVVTLENTLRPELRTLYCRP